MYRDELAKGADVASSSSTRLALREAERFRAQLSGAAKQASKAETGSADGQVARLVAAKARYVRRVLGPLSVDQLAGELAWVLRSDVSVGAKLVATEIVREQAELRAARGQGPAPNPAIGGRLLAQARRTLRDAEEGLEEPRPRAPEAEAREPAPAKAVPSPGTAGQGEEGEAGIEDLIAAIQKEGEQTRKTLREEGEKTRKTIEGSGRARGRASLLLGLATVLISFASLYLPTQESGPIPKRGAGESTLRIQGPAAPSAAGPTAGEPRLGPSLKFPPGKGQSAGGSVSLQAR